MSSAYFPGRLIVSGIGTVLVGIIIYAGLTGNKGIDPGAMILCSACAVYINCVFVHRMLKAQKEERASEEAGE